MAVLFDTHSRVVPTWLAAAQYLDSAPKRKAMNIVLEIDDPLAITSEDKVVMQRVDAALEPLELTLRTVAGTIFPLDMYRRFQRPAFYEKYKEMLKRGKKPGSWGTYAHRMMERPSKDGRSTINPLEMLVQRLRDEGQPSGGAFVSAYELSIPEPAVDLASALVGAGRQADAAEGDVPTYYPAIDGRRWLNMPCLSHLSFKRLEERDGHAVHLTAMYRSHHYCARALGNLLGLAQLLSFVAKEAELKVGTLTCLSSHAVLDVDEWGGVAKARTVLGLP